MRGFRYSRCRATRRGALPYRTASLPPCRLRAVRPEEALPPKGFRWSLPYLHRSPWKYALNLRLGSSRRAADTLDVCSRKQRFCNVFDIHFIRSFSGILNLPEMPSANTPLFGFYTTIFMHKSQQIHFILLQWICLFAIIELSGVSTICCIDIVSRTKYKYIRRIGHGREERTYHC